ncbi:MAG: protein kinase [Pirellulales bacterium]
MRGGPPARLVNLLERLRLATAAQVEQAAPRVRRLAGDLPDFESVWIDALVQARVLTPFQAAQINEGRGEALVCGPYVVASRLPSPHYAECFQATHLETGRRARLYRVLKPQGDAAQAMRELQRLIDRLAPLAGPAACVIQHAGIDGQDVWSSCAWVDGVTAAEWLAEYGRFPPQVVLHIAREMIARLADLELLGAVHGDVSCAGLVLERSGRVALPMPGLRGVVRPAEGYSFNELPVEAYDYLAPERVSEGGPPTTASDLYACGCVWWHLLTGRAPFAGGNSMAKLKSVHAGRLIDVRQIAMNVPDALLRAIDVCTARQVAERPAAMSEVRALLGAPARGGPAILSRCLLGQAWLWQPVRKTHRARRLPDTRRLAVAATVLIACAVSAGVWQSRAIRRTAEPIKLATAGAAADTSSSGMIPTMPPASPAAAKTKHDPQVTPTSAVEPLVAEPASELALPTGRPVSAGELSLQPGQRVHGQKGKRAIVHVANQGLSVACEDVCFEDVDFIWHEGGKPGAGRVAIPAMLTIAAQRVEFRGCSFSTPSDQAPVAVVWSGSAEASDANDGELAFTDCVFRGVQSAVDCRGTTGLSVELANTLCVAAGPIVRSYAPPAAGQTLAIALQHTTTRGDCAVLECRYRQLEEELGAVVVTVIDSALVTNPQGALLILAGPERPEPLLRAISWNGQGSLVTAETAVAVWRGSEGREQPLPEDELEVAGLVRSDVTFAGAAHEPPPSASRITRWNAPLQSDSPPGCDTSVLFLPDDPVPAK